LLKKAFPWLYDDSQQPVEEGRVIATGEKVILREKSLSDVGDDYAWRTDEELSRLDATRPVTMSYDAFMRYSQEEMQFTSPSSKRLAIDTHDGIHIGNCMYYDINYRRSETELGIMIGDRRYWGKGYGTDAVRTLLNHIFTTTDLNRVYLHTLEWNDRARYSFTKAGFGEMRSVFRSGLDFMKMEISHDDWEALNTAAFDSEDERHSTNGSQAS
jgi:RimJ/RimL family protein N-acetyltransferase